MTYGAPVWYSPKEIRERGTAPVAKLSVLQNKCLRSINGAYKAINVKVMEAEAGVMPLDMYLDQTVLQPRNPLRCAEIIDQAKETIRRNELKGKGKEKVGKSYSNGRQECMGQRQHGKNPQRIMGDSTTFEKHICEKTGETKMDGTMEPVFGYGLYAAQNAGTRRGVRMTARPVTSRSPQGRELSGNPTLY